jgi:hypothetical protein
MEVDLKSNEDELKLNIAWVPGLANKEAFYEGTWSSGLCVRRRKKHAAVFEATGEPKNAYARHNWVLLVVYVKEGKTLPREVIENFEALVRLKFNVKGETTWKI